MHEVLNALIVVAVVVLVIVRRFTRRRVDERRLLVLPLIIGVVGIAQGHLIDAHHAELSTGLLAAEIAAALLLGLGLGATTHVWREADGSLWSRGTWATFGVFMASIAVRGGLYALGHAAGARPGSGTVLISVAAWLLAQNAVIGWRSRELPGRVSVQP
ncbi:CcdC protein domain-containing protein [Actinoallomurus iriomotensis]|uniref:DUF1453 domain-containing protein n=1 Tax=Actinoallomurus iriomotensis TaxID=478107 RepID=A0A9W6RLK7_9ACTN|nr:CcdC protein domain-containing protein [Actinoallomurus iriomotensis]GLY77923.1 hypothetical protein Airi01_061900 [Actinoallomurus iriomotensis]